MPADRYLAHVVARTPELQHNQDTENLRKHLDYVASQVAPKATAEEMETAWCVS